MDLVVLLYCREVSKVWRATRVKCFVGKCGEFESDAPLYWKPVELFKECI